MLRVHYECLKMYSQLSKVLMTFGRDYSGRARQAILLSQAAQGVQVEVGVGAGMEVFSVSAGLDYRFGVIEVGCHDQTRPCLGLEKGLADLVFP